MNARFVGGPLDGQDYENRDLPPAVEFHSSEALRHYRVGQHTGFITLAPSVTYYILMPGPGTHVYHALKPGTFVPSAEAPSTAADFRKDLSDENTAP